jgi:hypothetical protein
MLRSKLADFDLPLSSFIFASLHSKSEAFGLFLPTRKEMGPYIVEGDGESMMAMPLEGPHAFKRNLLHSGNSIDGLLFSAIQLAVNVPSFVNPRAVGLLGDLSLEQGKVHILSIDSRSGWSDVEPFPLQIEVSMSSERPIAFREWSIVLSHKEIEVELWRHNSVNGAEED